MSGTSKQNRNEPDLLGYHLGLIDADERRAIESAMDADEIKARCLTMETWLAPLRCDDCRPPDDLASRIEARIERVRRPFAAADVRLVDDANTGSGPFLSARDLLALAAVITLFVGVFLPGYRNARTTADLKRCAQNLGWIGAAGQMYANANNGYLPYAGPTPDGAVWYRGGDGVPVAPSSRHGWLLVRYNFAPAGNFVDPGNAGDRPFDGQDADQYDDFADPRNNSYATTPMLRPATCYQFSLRTPIAAGMSPLVDEGRRLRRDPHVPKNSLNHDSAKGQNVLRADSSADFSSSTSGLREGDDIYRINGISDGAYTGFERPRSRSDAFLTP